MTDSQQDTGVITALVERLTHFRLPRAQDLKAKVDQGEPLDDLDIQFLKDVLEDAEATRTLIARHPELEDIAAQMVALYHEITAKALENEQQRSPS